MQKNKTSEMTFMETSARLKILYKEFKLATQNYTDSINIMKGEGSFRTAHLLSKRYLRKMKKYSDQIVELQQRQKKILNIDK